MHRQGRGQNATQPGGVQTANKAQQCLGAYKACALIGQGIILTRRPVSLCRGNLGWFWGTLAATGWGFCTAERSRSSWQGAICLSVRLGALSLALLPWQPQLSAPPDLRALSPFLFYFKFHEK